MALQTNELFSSASRSNDNRLIPRQVAVKTAANIGAAPLLGVGYPLAYNTSTKKYVPWTNGGANGTGIINCFVYVAKQSHATDDVHVVVMNDGDIHYDAILLPSGETQPNLKAALQSTATRSPLLTIVGLESAQ